MEFELPDDLTAESRDDLTSLRGRAVEAFNAVYALEKSAENMQTLRDLRAAINEIDGELSNRDEAEAALEAELAELAEGVVTLEDESDDDGDDEETVEDEAEPVAAAAAPRKITLPEIAKKQKQDTLPEPAAAKVVMTAAADVRGFAAGQELDWDGVAEAFLRRTSSFPKNATPNSTPPMTAQFAAIKTEWPTELSVDGDDPNETMRVMDAAADENKLPGGSLVAAGGWCAPSEVLYDFCQLESTDGLFSLPSINVRRAGIRHTLGPDFRAIFDGSGFCFTEQEDIDEEYTNESGTQADKPCYDVPCPDFTEDRLEVCGVCITSGILQDRAYPELTRRVVSGAVTAHIHRLDQNIISKVVAGSTAHTHPANPAGATAPILSAIEYQVEEYRYRNRLSRSRSLEAVFPFWVRGAIRADLALREGTALFDVSNSQIDSWFRMRGINPQYIVNWQENWSGLNSGEGRNFGAATPQTPQWPTQVSFLLYTAGTWVVGRKDIIELTAVHDSTQFRRNNFTALFTEEAYLVAQRCHDSRLINVPICPDGATHGGILLECDGTVTP